MNKKVSIQATLRGVPKNVAVVPRAQVTYRYRYSLQTYTKRGGWSPSISCDDWDTIVSQAEYNVRGGEECRIVDNGEPDKVNGV